MSDPLTELAELIDEARYALDHFDTLPDARLRLTRCVEAAFSLVHEIQGAADDPDWEAGHDE